MTTDYEKTLRIEASADDVFDAVTTADGLTAWWTEADGIGTTDGELRFTMTAPEPLRVRVDEAHRPSSVRWTVVECTFERDWEGTHPTFTIAPLGDGASELTFRHVGLTDELECIDMCTQGWNHYLGSLRSYVETGRGDPRGSEADLARRAS